MSGRLRLVIVGAGMACARLLEELIARAPHRYAIEVYGDEPLGSYNRILLSSVLAGKHRAGDIALHPPGWYEEHDVRLRRGSRVRAVDLARRVVIDEGGGEARYDRLVLATGSSASVPPLVGLDRPQGGRKPNVFVFRTLADCEAILAAAAGARRAVVMGGGLLGLEAARGLLARGLEVHVLHLTPHLMEQQLDARAGAVLARRLEQLGLEIHLQADSRAVLGEERAEGVQLKDGSSIACDLLVIATGIRPNVQLARDAGLLVRRGVVVGDDLSAPGFPEVHALGECAEHRGRTYGLVAPIWEQAEVLADRLSGGNALYRGSRVSTRLKVLDVDLAVMGSRDAEVGDEVVEFADEARCIYHKLIVREDRLEGAILLGDTAAAPGALQAFAGRTPLPARRAEVLFPAAFERPPTPICELPDATPICNCNGISKGELVAVVRGGARSLRQLCAATRAGSGCGMCQGQLRTLLEELSAEAPRTGLRTVG